MEKCVFYEWFFVYIKVYSQYFLKKKPKKTYISGDIQLRDFFISVIIFFNFIFLLFSF